MKRVKKERPLSRVARDARRAALATVPRYEGLRGVASSTLREHVRAFHERFGHPVRTVPAEPSKSEMQFRLRLIAEEFFELLAACEIWPKADIGRHAELHAKDIILEAIEYDFSGTIDLPEVVDALGDLDFVIEGTRLVIGVDGEPVMAEIQRANMSKEPVLKDGKPDPLAKPTKPEGWKPPDVTGVLARQGWKR